jgi:hypothetical protein
VKRVRPAVGAATENPGGSVSALPDTGSGPVSDPTSRIVILLALIIGGAARGGASPPSATPDSDPTVNEAAER